MPLLLTMSGFQHKDLPAAWGKPMVGAKPAAPAYDVEMIPGVPKMGNKIN